MKIMDFPNSNYNQIMFSLQESDNLVDYDNPWLISFQQEHYNPDLHEHVSLVDSKGKSIVNRPESSKRKKVGNRASNKLNSSGVGEDEKKMVHREIEKHRRKEMAKLYASLRDLLPLEFIKGNRSISDHMHQTVRYIKQLEENIKGLSVKRDQLKKASHTSESSTNQLPNMVSVGFCSGGVEISINSCSIEDGSILSGVLNTVAEEGLNVTSCSLTKVNDRLLHSIHTEALDLALINLSMLQQRLVFVANTQWVLND